MKIKTACFLLSLFHFGSAAALGLGELKVRSYLGQPLHATVALAGAAPNTTADCFSLESSTAAIAPLVRTQLSLEQSGSHAVLHIRTPQAINDPIAQFVLVSDCEARLKRDYVILLDPPSQIETVAISSSAPVAVVMPAAAATTTSKPRATRKAPRNTQRARAAAPRLATSASQSTTTRVSANASSTAPRLVLSGKHGSAAHAALALRLDTNLPDLTLPRPEPLTATEMSDENTALTRKLAHLETQLASLQQRNLELEAQRATTAPKNSAPAAKQPAQWPLYLLAIGLIAGAGLIVAGLRLRSRSRHPIVMMDDTAWTPPDAMPSLHEASRPSPPVVAPASQQPEMSPLEAASTEVKDDILDQAEVYMAHGHGELAVHLLQEHLRVAPDESPVPWLLLLDLLQREGDTAGYATASTECRRYFNIDLSGQSTSNNNEEGAGLETYPLLLEELVKVWKTPDASAFFDELIYDNRGGTRIGFEPHVYRDILMLRAIADQDKDSLAA